MRADAPSVCHSVCATLWGAALAVCDDFPMSALMWSLDRIVWCCPVCLTILQSECRCKVTRVCWGLYCVCVLWLFIFEITVWVRVFEKWRCPGLLNDFVWQFRAWNLLQTYWECNGLNSAELRFFCGKLDKIHHLGKYLLILVMSTESRICSTASNKAFHSADSC